MPTSEAYPGTQAVLRALALLKTFSDAQPELSLAELAQEIKLNKTTVYRLLTALESEGLVIRNSRTDTYRLGPEAIALGSRAIRANDLLRVSRPELEALAEQTREATTLEVLSEGQVLTLAEIPGSYLMGMAQDVGSHWPLHATSTGKVLLAHLPEAKLRAILPTPLVSLTPKTIILAEVLAEALAEIRRQGYAVANEELEVGFVAIGAPVRNHSGEVIAAVSIGGPTARLTSDKIPKVARLVKETGDRISIKLGFKPKT
jgi:DNA-binding IclR family transcriptional regulator